ncbi:MAG: hypothetical protein IJ220_02090 [Clostridia bacterium]|nr:hypothetical protein [Clostridia bacterium]
MFLNYDEIINYIENNEDSLDVSKVLEMTNENPKLNTLEKISSYQSLSNDQIVNYLLGKPEHFESLVKMLRSKSFIEVLKGIDDDGYKAKLLLFSGIHGVSNFLEYLEDDFYKKLVFKNVYNDMGDKETLEKLIDTYSEWRKALINSSQSEKEKAMIIANIEDNDLKEAMLPIIKEKENREIIIQSMTKEIDPEIEEYTQLAQQMICSFFESNGTLTNDLREKMEIVLQTINVKFSEILDVDENSKTATAGLADHFEKQILIRENLKEEPLSILQVLLHEYAHMFSNANFLIGKGIGNNAIEEGIADIFSDLVIKDFFERIDKVELKNGRTLSSQTKNTFSKGYILFNAWTRSMLYPFQKDKSDIDLITQYLLGDRDIFYEKIRIKDFANDRGIDFREKLKMEYDIGDIMLQKLYESNKNIYQDIDNNSIYAKNNFIFPIFELQHQLENKGIEVLKIFDNQEQIEASMVAKEYYQDRKLYEISKDDLKKFVALSNIPQFANSKRFVIDFYQYVNLKFNELSDEEIKSHSQDILISGIMLAGTSESIDSKVIDVFQKAMENELEKSKKIDKLEQFDKYIDLHGKIFDESFYAAFSKQTSPEGKELYERVSDFSIKLIDNLNISFDNYRERQDRIYSLLINQKSFGQKLIEKAKKVKIRIGEVLAKTFSFDKDYKGEHNDKEDPTL